MCVTVGVAANLFALDPGVAMSRYRRDAWGPDEGYSGGPVYAFAQSSDGYLWVGTHRGLFRFDGVTFRLAADPKSTPFVAGPILGLSSDVSGDLWVRLRGSSLVRRHNGQFHDHRADFPKIEAGITALGPAHKNGILLATFVNGILRLAGGKVETLTPTAGLPNFLVLSIAETSDGVIWMGTRDSGLFALRNGSIERVGSGLLDRKVNCLLATGNRELWIGSDNGLARWDGARITRDGIPRSLQRARVLAIIRDREANLWVATSSGLIRLNKDGAAALPKRELDSQGAVTALFEDREGNLWTGSASGIERLRDSAFLTYSVSDGMPSPGSGPVLADAQGRTWFGSAQRGLYWIKDGVVGRVTESGLDRDVVYSIAEGPGELWIGRQSGGLTRLVPTPRGLKATTYTSRDGLAQNSVYAVQRSRDGTVWAGTLSGGVSKLSNGRFTTYTVETGLASNTIVSILEGSDGTMWFATPNGLSALAKGRWLTYAARDGLPSRNVNCLWQDSENILWIGTVKGLAFLDSGRVGIPEALPEALQEQILGLAEDRNGSLWIATSHHVLRVNREKLIRGALEDGDLREYGIPDGLHGLEGVKRHRSVVADASGRIWFSMDRGLSVVDPARLSGSSAPAIVHIQGLLADGKAVDPAAPIEIPGTAQRITFRFAALSLSVPEAIRFRYTLDGYDHGWSEPTAARETSYTNLSPRSYRFRVVASNPDGKWNSGESVVNFRVAPLVWQTWWFRLGVTLAAVVAALAAYQYRLRRMTRQLNIRFEERLAERTRIAQELHDTLLQGFLSASMQLHVAADRVPEDSPAKPSLTRVMDLMRQVIDEGRNAVQGLRSSTNTSLDLAEAFSHIREELGLDDSAAFRVFVEGQPRAMHPVVRDEIYRIGREAVLNAFRHAQAETIEMELEYAPQRFRFVVRDNGCGIDPAVLRSGREGHWGLRGMRERAERIGGQLHVWSSASAGTEVELLAPGKVVFPEQGSSGFWRRSGRSAAAAGAVSNANPERTE